MNKSQQPTITHSEITMETLHIQHSFPFTETHNTIFEYKYILHKFDFPLKKNIRSLQVKINDVSPKIMVGLSLYSGATQLTDEKIFKPNRCYELLQFQYIPSQIIEEQIQIIATVKNISLLGVYKLPPTEQQQQPTPPIDINIDLNIKYSYFMDENITTIAIPHCDDIRKMTVKNGNVVIMKIRV